MAIHLAKRDPNRETIPTGQTEGKMDPSKIVMRITGRSTMTTFHQSNWLLCLLLRGSRLWLNSEGWNPRT
jgi:hypothetical protein